MSRTSELRDTLLPWSGIVMSSAMILYVILGL